MAEILIDPEQVRQRLAARYRNARKQWFAGEGSWPLSIRLGVPSEHQARDRLDAVRRWVDQWRAWQGSGELVWTERRWPRLGSQQLPERLLLRNPLQVSAWIGEQERWRHACARARAFTERWSLLPSSLSRHFDVLADYSGEDYEHLLGVLAWLMKHPDSGLYLRQLPVPGVHSKWIEARISLLTALLREIRGVQEGDFYSLAGIRRAAPLIRFRLLDSRLRARVAGLGDVTAPVDQIAELDLPLERVIIVENLSTGLAFGDLPGTVLFMALGYAVDQLNALVWLRHLPCWYWGDIDTHGFAILNRLRSHLPTVNSLLMDEATLRDHLPLCVVEEKQAQLSEDTCLSEQERALYRQLIEGRWGNRVRLEQERVGWPYAWNRILSGISCL